MARLILGETVVEPDVLADRVRRAATVLADRGIGPGDAVAFMLRNDVPIFEVGQAAQLLGAYALPINWHFGPDEVGFILKDSGAKVLVVHADLARSLGAAGALMNCLTVATPPAISASYGIAVSAGIVPAEAADWNELVRRATPHAGPPGRPTTTMLYTSGTTGKPKGVRRAPMTPEQVPLVQKAMAHVFGTRPGQTMLAVAPLYHAAPNATAIAASRVEGTVVLMPKFDAEGLLETIQRHRVTHVFMVPIMFVRLLRLSEAARRRYDLSSLEWVVHGAAPCPPDIKRGMIDWWGPILHEFYGASELGAIASCSSHEWLARPGTLGRLVPGAIAAVYDEQGRKLGPGKIGEIYARQTYYPDFVYHGLEDKRTEVERDGMVTCGDVGYFDSDGYLYLCDRKRDMVISGGVNIYPAEIEAALATMPGVADCAVFGIPDPEFGEALCAYVQPLPGAAIDAPRVQGFLRVRLSGFKVPKRVEFRDSLPREDSGKIFKRKLRDAYWQNAGRRI
jgi:long-chain acyl-CoA synthetase